MARKMNRNELGAGHKTRSLPQSVPANHQPLLSLYSTKRSSSPLSTLSNRKLTDKRSFMRAKQRMFSERIRNARRQRSRSRTYPQWNPLEQSLMAESMDAMRVRHSRNHLPAQGRAVRNRRVQQKSIQPTQNNQPHLDYHHHTPDWTALVTSSSAQLTEPLAPPPPQSKKHLLHDKEDGENLHYITSTPTKALDHNQWQDLKLRNEKELSVATIQDVVNAEDKKRIGAQEFAKNSESHMTYQQRALENKLLRGSVDNEAEEEERNIQRMMAAGKPSSQRCDSTRACAGSGPRIGKRASVVYKSFSSEEACPGDFVR